MKASELIDQLRQRIAEHGDLPVVAEIEKRGILDEVEIHPTNCNCAGLGDGQYRQCRPDEMEIQVFDLW